MCLAFLLMKPHAYKYAIDLYYSVVTIVTANLYNKKYPRVIMLCMYILQLVFEWINTIKICNEIIMNVCKIMYAVLTVV